MGTEVDLEDSNPMYRNLSSTSGSKYSRKTRWSYDDNSLVTVEGLKASSPMYIPMEDSSSEEEEEDSSSEEEREKMFGEAKSKILDERFRWREAMIAGIVNSVENNPEMSMEMLDWLECYNEWQYGFTSTGSNFLGGPPPLPETGNPAARARVKATKHLKYFVKAAEMAIQFYNKNHQDSEFEVVEILSGYAFYVRCDWLHINFTAKPKSASPDDKQSLKTFFAEHYNDDEDYGGPRTKLTEGLITACCLLEKGSTSTRNCESCPKKEKVHHPLEGEAFLFNIEVYL